MRRWKLFRGRKPGWYTFDGFRLTLVLLAGQDCINVRVDSPEIAQDLLKFIVQVTTRLVIEIVVIACGVEINQSCQLVH